MTDIMNATADDWLDLLPLVHGQGWGIYGPVIRNEKGQCPLCALAEAVGVSEISYNITVSTAWSFPRIYSARGASLVIGAADDRGHYMRPRLMEALGMVS